MKLRALLIALIVATTAILVDHAGPARAATINFDASGDVTGITGLDVGGSLFDIAFIYGGADASYNTAYGSTLPRFIRYRRRCQSATQSPRFYIKVDVNQSSLISRDDGGHQDF